MYKSYYGLDVLPFENTPNSLFFFPTTSHKEVLATLIYGVKNKKGFIVISGEVGTGKTMLVSLLKAELDSQVKVLELLTPKITPIALLSHIDQQLGTPLVKNAVSASELTENIYNKLARLDEQSITFILVVDEAHLLPDETLEAIRLLSNLEREGTKLIHFVLLGQPELSSIFDRQQHRPLKERINIYRELKLLDRRNTSQYIRFRLNQAGSKKTIFPASVIAKIYVFTKGNPQMINQVCDHCLTAAFACDKKRVDHMLVDEICDDIQRIGRGVAPIDSGQSWLSSWLFKSLAVMLSFMTVVWLGFPETSQLNRQILSANDFELLIDRDLTTGEITAIERRSSLLSNGSATDVISKMVLDESTSR